ncbi:alpha/beta hydrolase [Pendulispora albinea]|uniref:Alpha/beta hydrolase n=1 Tax=Pendulispora albinea TaxID=2741071 RepID=A0ABZ2M8P7_9BACT
MPEIFGQYTVPGLDGERLVRVHVPSSAPAPSRSPGPVSRRRGVAPRPLLVLFDGQNVFDDEPSFSGGWYVHTAVERLRPTGYNVPIIVAIDHGGEQRIDELGPFRAGGRGGKADVLLEWLGATLLPEVRGRYSIVEGPVGVCIGGSSMGGLASLYAHFRRPDLFGGVIAMSPSFWFGQRALFSFVAKQENPAFSRIYLDGGLQEGSGNMASLVARMAEHLTGRGYGPEKLKLVLDPKGGHGERHWRRRFPAALRFMYRKPM